MNNMIQASRCPAERAWLFQQQPSSLINAVRGRESVSICRHPSGYLGGGQLLSIAQSGTSTFQSYIAGSAGTFLLADPAYPAIELAAGKNDEISDRIRSPGWFVYDISMWTRWVETTKELFLRHRVDSAFVPSKAATLRVERLTRIQAVLGLPLQVMAEALGVSRQGLYKWLDAAKDIKLQEANQQRLAVVERLSKLWGERSKAPLASVIHEPVASGRTVRQMLTDTVLDEVAITSAFDELTENIPGKPKSLSQRMAEVGFKRRSTARALPSDE